MGSSLQVFSHGCVLTKAEPEPATWFPLKPELLTNKPVATSLFKSITNVTKRALCFLVLPV